MDTGSMFGFLDIIVFGCGLYSVYSWYMLTQKQQILKTFLVAADTNPEHCKDIKGFADFMGKKLLITAFTMLAYGGISLYSDYVRDLGKAIWAVIAVFLAVVIWYCVQLRKADALYFQKGAKRGNTIKDKALKK